MPARINLMQCTVIGHRNGYGFARPLDGSEDHFLSARQMRLVFDGDEVLVGSSGMDNRGRLTGQIVKVLRRAHTSIVGSYEEEADVGYLIPYDKRIPNQILIPNEHRLGAVSGQIVLVQIRNYPSDTSRARGEVCEILGDYLDPGLEIECAIRSHGIPREWDDEALREARMFGEEPKEEDKRHRVDLRSLAFVTIDGEDAKDFDDAVYCEESSGGHTLWVAISDVAHYVRIDSALDRAACERGNSVYFPGFVVPMLPEALSNGLCSLKPRTDRLAMVCEMNIDIDGQVTHHEFYEAVIHSNARLTYDQVTQAFDSGNVIEISDEVVTSLRSLLKVFRRLRSARVIRGAIDFETVETRIVFDESRKIQDIVPVHRNDAHKIIEECMLAANVAAAQLLRLLELPMLYRVHLGPSAERLEVLRAFLSELSLDLHGGQMPTPLDYQKLLSDLNDDPKTKVIQSMMLRSLSQAAYTPENAGHFGLNYDAYTHFTSPIRRYPDLLIHRAIRWALSSNSSVLGRKRDVQPLKPKVVSYPYDEHILRKLGKHCSLTERRAENAAREVTKWLKCEFLSRRQGEIYTGVITSITRFGIFVELDTIYIEGLVHISALPSDYYYYDHMAQRLVGERVGRVYQAGDSLTVRVIRVDLNDRKIDLDVLEMERCADNLAFRKGKSGYDGKVRRNRALAKTRSKKTNKKRKSRDSPDE